MYEGLLEVFAEHPGIAMTYYKGILEIMTPLPEHERYSWTIGRLLVVLSEELNLEILGLKSTTWRLASAGVGKEADECFYIQHEAQMRGKLKIDLTKDPPPDLVIEVETTHSSMNMMAIYADLKVPEVWRYCQVNLNIYLLIDGVYKESETSWAFGSFPVKKLTEFIQLDFEKGENARMREFREWVRSQQF
jgi:Uma2 family endonuclease